MGESLPVPEGPLARRKRGGFVRVLQWQLCVDGWWLRYPHPEIAAHQRDNESIVIEERWLHEDEVEKLDGVDYSRVPCSDARTPRSAARETLR